MAWTAPNCAGAPASATGSVAGFSGCPGVWREGYSPSLREIAEELGLALSTVSCGPPLTRAEPPSAGGRTGSGTSTALVPVRQFGGQRGAGLRCELVGVVAGSSQLASTKGP